METIRATDNLIIEMHPGEGLAGEACLVIKGGDTEESQGVVVYLHEAPALCEALAEAAALLAAGDVVDELDDEEISLQAAADLFGVSHAALAQAAFRGELAARRSGLSWLTTRWAVREALAAGRLPPD